MFKFKKTLIIIFILLFSQQTLAQDAIRKGQVSPYDGILLTPEINAKLIGRLELLKQQVKLEVDEVKAIEKVTCEKRVNDSNTISNETKKILISKVDASQKKIDKLSKELSISNSGVSKFVAIALTLSGCILTALSTYVIMKVTQ
jgi:hypothetical protein